MTSDREQTHWGGTIEFDEDGLSVDGERVPLNSIEPLRLNEQGNLVIKRIGAEKPWRVVDTAGAENVEVLVQAVNRLVTAVHYREQRSVTGWPPGSVGDVSARIGYDVRDLKMAGYSDDEIDSVLYGQRALDELLSREPGLEEGVE